MKTEGFPAEAIPISFFKIWKFCFSIQIFCTVILQCFYWVLISKAGLIQSAAEFNAPQLYFACTTFQIQFLIPDLKIWFDAVKFAHLFSAL